MQGVSDKPVQRMNSRFRGLSDTMDRIFGESDAGRWTEFVEINGSSVVRYFLRRELETLVVETNSVERFDRILKVLREEAGDLGIIEEARTDLSSTTALAVRADENITMSRDEDFPPEILQAVRDLMREKEDAWLDESIPALGGFTLVKQQRTPLVVKTSPHSSMNSTAMARSLPTR